MTAAVNKSLPFLLGFGFAFLPSYGPFLGLLVFLASRLSLRRSDLLWLSAALFLAFPLLLHQGASGLTFGLLQVLAPWLVYRAFAQFQLARNFSLNSTAIGFGLLTGLLLVVGLGWLQVEQLNFAYKTIAQAIVWESTPSLYGHAVLVLGLLMAMILPDPRYRVASLGISALGILASGSREAAIAWVVISLLLILVRPARPLKLRLVEIGLFSLMLAVAAGLGPLLGWGRVGFLVDLVPVPDRTQNLVQGSEIAHGDWWDKSWVEVAPTSVILGEDELVAYSVTKTDESSWLRLQQVVPIFPDRPYTLSVWMKPGDDSQPGLQGWGRVGDSGEVFAIVSWLDGETWRATRSGPGTIIGSGVVEREAGWTRAFVSFILEGGTEPVHWYVGLAPDRRSEAGGWAQFAGFQLEYGEAPTGYTPGAATRGLGLGVARLPYWQAAWQGFTERPLSGWGPETFPAYVADNWPEHSRFASLPSHSHNLILQFLFERGLIGLAGIVLLLIALTHSAVASRDRALLLVILAVLFANMFDYTLLYGGVIYPLAAVAGWRSVSYRPTSRSQEVKGQQVAVRLTLAAADFLAALAALWLALLVIGRWWAADAAIALPEALYYALLLWPAMAWREGLYPGYGLTAPQELKRQITASAYAGLLLAAGAMLFFDELIPRSALVGMVAFTMVIAPVGRALAKKMLLELGWWGRSVVILGAGERGRSVARALQSRPLDGLHPIAFFDDDNDLIGRRLEGVPVRGKLADADAFGLERHIEHAIVTVHSDSPQRLGNFIHERGAIFRRVQFVPDLAPLPSEGVNASTLDDMLALEVRRGLYSRRNQVAKRTIDVVLSCVLLLLLLPLFAALYLWVRLDSAGPALYGSERVGQRGRVFRCLKFRTMYVDAEERLSDMLADNEGLAEEYRRYHKLKNDPRLTSAGRIMRQYSLDELAQLVNVFKGEMSLVGPRPYLTRELPDMGEHKEIILEARPGITGYWQVSGRNAMTFEQRLKSEAHYVRNWSIWWDIILMLKTVTTVLRGRGAH